MNHSERSVIIVGIVVLVASLVGAIGLAARAIGPAPAAPAARGATVTVRASGSATAAPDTLSATLDVTAQAPSTGAALALDDRRVALAESDLRTAGIARAALATSGLSTGTVTDPAGAVTGYSADQTLTVTVHRAGFADLARALPAVAAALGDGLTVDALDYSLSDQSAALVVARRQALDLARVEAAADARALGERLGPVRSVVEAPASTPVFPSPVFSAARAGSVPLAPAPQSVSAQVTVVYALR